MSSTDNPATFPVKRTRPYPLGPFFTQGVSKTETMTLNYRTLKALRQKHQQWENRDLVAAGQWGWDKGGCVLLEKASPSDRGLNGQ